MQLTVDTSIIGGNLLRMKLEFAIITLPSLKGYNYGNNVSQKISERPLGSHRMTKS